MSFHATTSGASAGSGASTETESGATTSLLSGGTDEWFARTGPSGTRTFLTDLQGSTLALGDSTGGLTATYSYDPYGNATVGGTPDGNSTTYTGREDDGTGLMYYRARYYSSTLQRFIGEDPAGVGGGSNLYAYAADAPTNYTDPSGNNPLLIGCAAGGAINGLIELGIQKLSGRKNYGAIGSAMLGGCIAGALGGWLGKLGEGGGCLLNSFTPDTPVLMADGTRKPIQDIRIGDRVQATDPQTGRTNAEPVTALIDGNGQKHLVQITTRSGNGHRAKTGTVTATDGHPFWEPKRHKWITAVHLNPGMWLRTSTGTWTQITAVHAHIKSTHAYNLTIDNLHTYYVLAGDTPVLVHNCGEGDLAGRAIVYLDREKAHASIEVLYRNIYLHSEQIGAMGTDVVGSFFRGELSGNAFRVNIPLPNAVRAQAFQRATEDYVFGAYDLETRSCVTYCLDVLRAGGMEGVPDASAGWRKSTLWI